RRQHRSTVHVRAPAVELARQGYRVAHLPDRELAIQLERVFAGPAKSVAAELERRVVLDVEEVGALQMTIPHLVVRAYARGPDLLLDGRLSVCSHLDPTRDLSEPAPTLRKHVAGDELNRRVRRVELITPRRWE